MDVYFCLNDNVATFYLASGYNKLQIFCQKIEMDYNNGQEHPITIHTSVMSDYEDYALPPKQSKRSFCYSLTGLTIGCKQAE